MLAGSTWGVSSLRYYHFKKFSFRQLSRCTNLCREMVRAVISPQCNVWLSFQAACCLCNVSSHLFSVPSEHTPASGTNRCYTSTLLRGITSLNSSEYCGSCSNGSLFPQGTFFLSLSLGSRKLALENEIPVLFLQIGNLAHKLTFYNSVSGMEIMGVELFGLVTSCCLLE